VEVLCHRAECLQVFCSPWVSQVPAVRRFVKGHSGAIRRPLRALVAYRLHPAVCPASYPSRYEFTHQHVCTRLSHLREVWVLSLALVQLVLQRIDL
jgi:hypothetical protein